MSVLEKGALIRVHVSYIYMLKGYILRKSHVGQGSCAPLRVPAQHRLNGLHGTKEKKETIFSCKNINLILNNLYFGGN